MRVNIKCGNDIRPGYINIDNFASTSDLYQQGDIQSLDWLSHDGKIDEILALGCLEYLENIKNTLINWHNKLKPGGILKILVPDCYSVAKAFGNYQFDLNEYLQIMLGTTDNRKINATDTNNLIKILNDLKFDVILKRYEGINIYIEAQKC